ncbi:MAG: LysM peptidoglycan-binding domain-containing protein, partial [Gemmatimonadota bacterium]
MRLVTAILIGLVVATPLRAQEPVRQQHEHVVKKGDTLWDLAGTYYTNPFRWPTIYEANTVVVEDPHWIYPDEVLRIPGIPGVARAAAGEPTGAAVVRRVAQRPVRTVFYRRPVVEAPQRDRPTLLSEPEAVRLPVKTGEFTSAPFLADPDDLAVFGRYIRPIREGRPGRGKPVSAHPEDELFVSYEGDARPGVGDRFMLVTVGDNVRGAPRGTRIIEPRGMVRVTELAEEVIKVRVEAQFGPVYSDQLMIPVPMFPDFVVEQAEPVEFDIYGRILGFMEEQPLYSRSDLGFIDLGSEDGVKVGDLFHA